MRLKTVIHTAAFFGLCVGAASAQDRAGRFAERDGNGDGVLTPHEYQTTGGHPGNFRALDTNGDGVLSRGEFVGRDGTVENESYEAAEAEPAPVPYPEDRGVWTKPEFRKLDANRDNVLTKREFTGNATTFRRLDLNGDGYISPAEYAAAAPGTGDSAYNNGFVVKDRDRDGMLTRAEYADPRTFDRVDRNDDGRISHAEFVNPPPATDGSFINKDRNRDGMLTRGEYADSRTFDRVDRNDDGRISYDEFLNPPSANAVDGRFDELDRNNDGILSRREWDGAAATFRGLDRNRDGRVTRDEFVL